MGFGKSGGGVIHSGGSNPLHFNYVVSKFWGKYLCWSGVGVSGGGFRG